MTAVAADVVTTDESDLPPELDKVGVGGVVEAWRVEAGDESLAFVAKPRRRQRSSSSPLAAVLAYALAIIVKDCVNVLQKHIPNQPLIILEWLSSQYVTCTRATTISDRTPNVISRRYVVQYIREFELDWRFGRAWNDEGFAILLGAGD